MQTSEGPPFSSTYLTRDVFPRRVNEDPTEYESPSTGRSSCAFVTTYRQSSKHSAPGRSMSVQSPVC